MSDPYAQPGSQQPQPPTNTPGPAYPAAPQDYPGTPQAYPGTQGYPPGQPYAQPYPAAQPYPVAQPYAPTSYPGVAVAQAPRSKILGVVSLIFMVITTVASGVLIVMLNAAITETARLTAHDPNAYNQSEFSATLAGYSLALVVGATVGFVCWVIAIVAAATNRGRVAGVIGIVLGVVAPIALLGYFFIGVADAYQRYAG